MTVTLEAIKLNHDSSDASTSALNIRKNGSEFISVPEWVAGVSVTPEDSRAAYGKAEVGRNTVTIQARFSGATGESRAVEIRALDPTVDPPPPVGCMGLLLWLLRRLIRALFGNVLGEVKARSVRIPANGMTGFESFELIHTKLHQVGVGMRTTSWRWQYREQGGSWTDFETTHHRIYVLLRVPTDPWQQLPHTAANTQLPWTDVLDKACVWAIAAPDAVAAASQITARIYDLGKSVVTYDCPHGGSSAYAYPNFDCTAFLERIGGGPGNGVYVNCTDCATFVSVFSNAVGCDLWASRMGEYFDLNPLLAIGSNTWQTACGWGGFSYHEVAWVGACTAAEPVYDACLQVDGDADPTSAPHTARLPTNYVFGTVGSGDYRDHLSPGGTCDPMPATRIRRAVQ